MAAVRSIFRHVGMEGASLGEVARRLQSAGMPAPGAGSGEAGSPWHRNSIRYLIRSDLYRPLTAAEVAASGLVSQEAARGLDPARSYALWTYGKRRRKTRRVRGEGGESRDRHTYDERPREEWSAAAVDLTDAHLVRDHVDAARERISNNRRRPPSTVAQRFWQLSGGIARCAECGCALSPNAMKRKSSGAIAAYYRCTQKYNSGPRDCPNGRSMRAEAFEQAVWDAIYALLSDPERLRRQHRAHVERKRAELRGDPDREAAALAGRLQKLERRRSGYLDQEADGIMSREELRAKLAGLEAQRKELEGALREAQGRRQSIEELERQWHTYTQLAEHFDRLTYLVASDADRRRLYQALRLRVDVDAEGTIRLSGIFDPDLYLLDVLSDFPRDPSEPVPKVPAELGTRIVVTPDSSQPRAS